MNKENNRNFLEGKKYNIITFGCQMNEHDSETIAGMLEEEGCRQVLTKEESDITIINTCSIRENADKRFFGTLGQLKKIKEKNPSYMACVCGCMMQQQHVIDTIHEKYPWVDIIFGTHNIDRFPELLERAYMEQDSVMEVLADTSHIAEGLPAKRLYQHKSFVNIMYGCNNFCTYCIVPYVRGRERSREPEAIIEEALRLRDSGVQEIMLLGQNVNSYRGGGAEFANLLYRLDRLEIPRIRFMTSHPKDLSDDLIGAYRELKHLMPHLHLPVQAGDDEILKQMNRHYTREKYLSVVQKLRAARPEIGLTTDIIVGFPGETEAQFEETMSLVKEVRYDSAYTFIYSPRAGTIAAKMPDGVRPEEKSARIQRLIALQQSITAEILSGMVGNVEPVLVESVSARDAGSVGGKTPRAIMVNFPGDESLIGETVNVKITSAGRNTLRGEIV